MQRPKSDPDLTLTLLRVTAIPFRAQSPKAHGVGLGVNLHGDRQQPLTDAAPSPVAAPEASAFFRRQGIVAWVLLQRRLPHRFWLCPSDWLLPGAVAPADSHTSSPQSHDAAK